MLARALPRIISTLSQNGTRRSFNSSAAQLSVFDCAEIDNIASENIKLKYELYDAKKLIYRYVDANKLKHRYVDAYGSSDLDKYNDLMESYTDDTEETTNREINSK